MASQENPSAFPRAELRDSDGCGLREGADGMTLRDYFAGQALPRVIESKDIPVWAGNEMFAAIRAYEFADAMLAAREQSA